GIVCLVAYLVIRGKPFEDPNHATYVRMLLSLAIAVLGATTVAKGLNLKFDSLGFSIRAAGAAALFVICYFAAPKVDSLHLTLKEPDISIVPIKQVDFRSKAPPDKDEKTRLESPVYITVPVGL